MQLGLELQQRRGDDSECNGQAAVAVPDHDPEGVAEQKCDDGGGAGVRFWPIVRIVVSGNDHDADEQETRGDDPGASDGLCDQRRRAAEQGHQRERAQPRLRAGRAFALQDEQQADRHAG